MWKRIKKFFPVKQPNRDAAQTVNDLVDPKSDFFDPEFAQALWEEHQKKNKK